MAQYLIFEAEDFFPQHGDTLLQCLVLRRELSSATLEATDVLLLALATFVGSDPILLKM
jgi:hypothetical protein